ncbi:MAG: NifB/NifX family molybdenum-iron cluster-binding protein [Acidobacteriota bacterium]
MAVTQWLGRVAPLFDTARRVVVVDVRDGARGSSQEGELPDGGPSHRIQALCTLGVDALICGAISRPIARMLGACGISVIPFVAGSVDDVLNAYTSGRLQSPQFAMPGCGQGRGRGGRGPGGQCVCPKCGRREPHLRGSPCSDEACPVCGSQMMRGRGPSRGKGGVPWQEQPEQGSGNGDR